MDDHRKKIIACLFVLCYSFHGFTQEQKIARTDNQLLTELDQVVDEEIQQAIGDCPFFGISIGIYAEGKKSFYNYGTIEKGRDQLPTRNTIYEIGSITKTFTGVLLAHAVIGNKVRLSDDVRLYLPEAYEHLEYRGNPVEIVHLANHTAGLPEDIIPNELHDLEDPTMFDVINLFEGDSLQRFLEGLRGITVDTLPGTKIKYSNTGMILLGLVLEKVYNRSYSALVKKYVTEPLGMDYTDIVRYVSDTTSYTKGYDPGGNTMPHITFQIAGAAGGLTSTADDMLKYIVENIRESDEAIRLSHEATIRNGNEILGLGWQIREDHGKDVILWHDGGEPGFSSYIGIIPGEGAGIICLANRRGIQYELEMAGINILNRIRGN